MGIRTGPDQRDQLLAFLALLQRWNRAYNLTAIVEPGEMVARHLLDSLSLLPYLSGGRFLDAGTGPGLPGVPLAIVCPDRAFVLLDSNGKKVRFLRQVRRELGLVNIEPVQGRLENCSVDHPPDAVLARALAPLERLVHWSQRWLDLGVPLLAMKGDLSQSELQAVPEPYNVRVNELKIPGLSARRCLATVEKR
ncbi:MAG: 16S rRNA (guanine(527)-N(7))-methyltransferase RsmG [Wenzhouxiangella sp.]|nr:MAG: 16S rRNA (guanine(527)-N(7))-methyltransferase RsmG [Wenzhouxiangella sp.]